MNRVFLGGTLVCGVFVGRFVLLPESSILGLVLTQGTVLAFLALCASWEFTRGSVEARCPNDIE
ncbi:hypothetical protein HY626_00270 [Candidatus Uhrbacteria bacterium]|nr:hypothetical protein [Candidatus Uhrbacteria bacterium]